MRRWISAGRDLQVRGLLAQDGDHFPGVGLQKVEDPAQVHQVVSHLAQKGQVRRVGGGRLQQPVGEAHRLEEVAQGLGGVEVVVQGLLEAVPQGGEAGQFFRGEVGGGEVRGRGRRGSGAGPSTS